MGLNRRQKITNGAAVFQALTLVGLILSLGDRHKTALNLLVPPQFHGKRIPELDNRVPSWTGTWLGNDQVITGVPDPSDFVGPPRCSQPDIFDLRTHINRPLPHLPSLGDDRHSYRRNPVPSPDGKWLLYAESQYNQAGEPVFQSLRLIHPDGSGMKILSYPAGAHYSLSHWLADSSGWIATGYKPSKDNASNRLGAWRFTLATLDASPQQLALREFYGLATITNTAKLIFNDKYSLRPMSVPLNAPSARPEPLDIRQGDIEALWPGHHGGLWPLQFSRNGQFLLVHGYSRSQDRQRGLWQISIPAGTPQCLLVHDNLEDFSLSPDGKKILYWCNVQQSNGSYVSQAYLLTLPERKR